MSPSCKKIASKTSLSFPPTQLVSWHPNSTICDPRGPPQGPKPTRNAPNITRFFFVHAQSGKRWGTTQFTQNLLKTSFYLWFLKFGKELCLGIKSPDFSPWLDSLTNETIALCSAKDWASCFHDKMKTSLYCLGGMEMQVGSKDWKSSLSSDHQRQRQWKGVLWT